MDSKKFYLNKLSKLSSIIGDIKNKEFKISLARLIVFVILIVSAIYTFQVSLWIFFITLSILFLVFLFLIKHQISLKSKRIQLENRAAFYHNEINILDGKENICYNGSGLVNDKHAYAHDLDIIGKSSIYEKINRSKTYFGTHYLSRFLLSFPNHNEVHERQEAIAEISTLDDWREKFHGSLFGLTDQYNFNISSVLEENLNFEYDFFKKKSLQIIVKLVPIIWLFLFLIYFYFGANFKPILIGFGMLIFVLYFKYAKEIGKIQLALSKSIENFVAYTEALNWIFEASWKSPLLQSTISPYRKTKENEQVAVKELVDLKKLIDLLDYRLNMIVGIILNLFLLWDFRIIIKI